MLQELVFLTLVFLAVIYYTFKKRFYIVYTTFLSILIGGVLQYLVSNSLSFSSIPPSMEILVLSTLSVFNWAFWIPTLVFFILAMDFPLCAVSGLLLGYGLGKWHSIKRKKIMFQKGEAKRKVIHSSLGLFLGGAALFLNKWILLPVFASGCIISVALYKIKIPIFSKISEEVKREKEWAGKGAFYFMLGSLLPIYIEQPWIILVIALGDGLSTLIGRFLGYTPIYGKKTLEGTFAGFLAALAVSRHFYTPAIVPAFVYLIAELIAPIDDNLAIPIAMSALYLF